MGVILKGFADLFHPSGPAQPNAASSRDLAAGGELKKDPVCGTYVSAASSIKKTLGGETYYFCSADCRDKFRAKTA
jgi:YHS domain-containing protein